MIGGSATASRAILGTAARRLLRGESAAPDDAVVAQAARYGFASALALALDAGVFLWLAGGPLGPGFAGMAGYLAGLMLHFALCTRLVFDASATGKRDGRLFLEFAATGLVGTAVTGGIIAILASGLGAPALAAKLVAVLASFGIVFALRRAIVFAPRRAPDPISTRAPA